MILDLSGLAAPAAIQPLAYEPVLAELVAAAAAQFQEKGIDYDVGGLETDPVKIVLEGFAAHEVAVRARVNDALKAVIPAFAKGSDLDAIVARTGVGRASGESDVQLLERYLVSLARPSAGSVLGYRARILEAWPARGDVALLGPVVHGRRGDVDIVLAAQNGEPVPAAAINAVQAAVSATDAKPLTDVVAARTATVVPYQIRQRIRVAEGRNSGPIRDAALSAARAFVVDRYQIGVTILRNAIIATAYVPGVVAVSDLTDGGDVVLAVDEVGWCDPASIVIEVEDR